MRWSSRFPFAPAAAVVAAALLAGGSALRSQRSSDLPPPQQSATPSSVPFPEPPKHAAPEFFVMIDASHGGDETGASLGPAKIPEKDISLALARLIKRQLEERGIAARLLRDADINVSLEQRAAITNEEHAGLYVSVHASQPGKGVRVYAPALLMAHTPPAGRFLPWESAQAGSLQQSRLVARTVADELRKTGLTVATLGAPLRPLNNVIPPAIAVEWAPGTEDLHAPQMQRLANMVAAAIASSIPAVRNAESKGMSL